MPYAERIGRSAVVVDSNGCVEKLSRIPFMSGSFNEAWLQELIASNPSILPSHEVGSEYSPLVCIGKEVPVGSGDTQGYIDNLYVTPSGNIVIVETKLFRNQEARRTVVAQIIDYAKELQRWDASKLDKVAADYTYQHEGQASRIIDLMARNGFLSFSDEAKLVDRLNINLKKASFLLLIVGDGIRSNVEQLADFLNDNTSMAFHLALVELEVYQHGSDTIVIPNLLTKTSVIERYISIYGTAPEKATPQPTIRKPILSRREFVSVFADQGGYDPDEISEFISDLEAINGLTVGIQPTELTIRFCPDDDRTYALLTFSISGNRSDLYVMPGRIYAALERHGIFPMEADDFLNFYKPFVDRNRCKTEPYDYQEGFYYAKIDDVLNYTHDFIRAAEQFAINISNKD